MPQVLILVGSFILLALGLGHIFLTLFKTDFDPADPQLKESMERTSVKGAPQLVIYPMWVGLNITHSMSLIILATFLGLLAGFHMDLLATAPVFLLVAIGVGLICMGLAKRYFFRPPLVILSISTLLFVVAAVRLYL